MKGTLIKLLILLGATALLPWVACLVGQVSVRAALWAHIAGVVVVIALKFYDLFKDRRAQKGTQDKGLDGRAGKEVNESGSGLPPTE